MIFCSISTFLFTAGLVAFSSFKASEACVDPTGLASEMYDAYSFPDPPFGIFGTAILTSLPGIGRYETPIQMRNILGVGTGIYATAAAFETDALEFLGRSDLSEARRRCAGSPMFDEHRAVTLAYTVAFHFPEFLPTTGPEVREVVASWNLDINICDDPNFDCTDISTPWGLAKSILEDTKAILAVDGWNANGSLSSSFNRIPFSDWRTQPYVPVPGNKKWSPLQEHDGNGFLFRQEHVTPHIGETARSFFLGDADICSRELRKPNYDYEEEARLVLERTYMLDEVTKAQVEYFDSKTTSIVPLQAQYFIRAGFTIDSWEFILTDYVTIATLYEAIIVAWKEKVRLNRIRPTTWIQENLGDEIVESYRGPDAQAGPIPAKEWQPYIRVMPHAEYPSGSSCLCKAFAKAQIAITGVDDVTSILNGPLAQDIAAGSSLYEENQPSQDLTLLYSSWSEVANECGLSRLDGGMHFTAAVPDGEELCGSIGDKVAQYFMELISGVTPAQAIPIEVALTVPPESRSCGQN
mmetsp:Transcript_27444/g.40295  ORF Transcript_27444/g.40295 Transcript_27444/m.40295 type:complete len:524 (-) Transcript_27444:180-1751(-)